jgi:hypothetical protein
MMTALRSVMFMSFTPGDACAYPQLRGFIERIASRRRFS